MTTEKQHGDECALSSNSIAQKQTEAEEAADRVELTGTIEAAFALPSMVFGWMLLHLPYFLETSSHLSFLPFPRVLVRHDILILTLSIFFRFVLLFSLLKIDL